MPLIFPLLSSLASMARVPAIAAFLANLLVPFIQWLTKFFSARMVMTFAAIGAIVTLTLGMLLVIKTAITAITVIAPPYYGQMVALLVPPNAELCVSTILGVKAARWVWEWQYYFIAKVAGM